MIKTFEATLANGTVVWLNAATIGQARRIAREEYGHLGAVVTA